MDEERSDDPGAPGWDAIDSLLKQVYGDQEPLHWGTVIKYCLGGNDPLDGISAYRSSRLADHWHFVSFGLSELYQKESDDPDYSGWGIEFTFRLARSPGEEQPPMWALNFLQNLARYVFESGRVFAPGHHMHLNGPIALESDTLIEAIGFVHDPELEPIDTPHGRLEFIQIVGLTNDEYTSILQWDWGKALDLIGEHQPYYVCDLARKSLLRNPEFVASLEEGSRRDGSSTGILFSSKVQWEQKLSLRGKKTVVTVDMALAQRISLTLPGRIPFGNPLSLSAPEAMVTFEPADSRHLTFESDNHLFVGLSSVQAVELAETLASGVGSYPVPGYRDVVIRVERTLIRDNEGNVVKVIE